MNINSKKLVYFLVISLICGLVVGEAAHANIIKITGKVHADGTPIVDVIVAAPDFGDIPTTDTTGENGSYSIPYISFGNVAIQVGDKILVQFTDVYGDVIERTHTVTAADISAGEATFNINVSVNIPDANLRAAIETMPGVPITLWDMATLTNFSVGLSNISNLTGLEHATNLTDLLLTDNEIVDISALVGLTNLIQLDLSNNSISDISALADLTNLTTYLFLTDNEIVDISALVGLTNLTALNLFNNTISDISALADLTNLTDLFLTDNEIVDISALVGLTNLIQLDLSNNSISDISPLVSNTGLRDGDWVNVKGNPLNAVSINTHIPTLQSRGVAVEFDPPQTVNIPDANLRAKIESALGKASGATITATDMAGLTGLNARSANISNLTGLEHATNLISLYLGNNSISDISALSDLTKLTGLYLEDNSISDILPLSGLTKLTELTLEDSNISDISPLSGLTNLTDLSLWGNSISDLSPLSGLTNLTDLTLGYNSILDLSPLLGLTNLTDLSLSDGEIVDISPLLGLTNLTALNLFNNTISDISAVSGLTNLTRLWLGGNSISNISAVSGLTNLTELFISGNSISDLSPLVSNTGLGDGDWVDVKGNPLNTVSINTHIPTLQSRGVAVEFDNIESFQFDLSVPAGISLIHVPLKVTTVGGVPKTIEFIGNLYDALGGADTVNFLITYDPTIGGWSNYSNPQDKGGPADNALTDDQGIIALMKQPVTVQLAGDPLGTNGTSTITLNQGPNLVGLPLRDSRITRVSDLFALDGIGGNVPAIILADRGEFKLVGRAGDPGDIEITGGQSFILIAQRAATVGISGEGWTNVSGTSAAPPVGNADLHSSLILGIQVTDTTPVLALRGAVVDEQAGLNKIGFRVTVKNLSTGRAVTAVKAPDEVGYRLTVVDIETGRAATIGDTLEISAQSPNPFFGVQPLRYTVTVEDVKRSLIQLPELVVYEIPAETELLHNYPNPFNPETWIPYRLAEDAFVTLIIYDLSGRVVRTLEVGHRIAAVYESRSKAIYWDGRNEFGEQAASGVYFYHLSAGDYSTTRKMLVVK